MQIVRIHEGKENVYRAEETLRDVVDKNIQKSMKGTKLQIQGAQKTLSKTNTLPSKHI